LKKIQRNQTESLRLKSRHQICALAFLIFIWNCHTVQTEIAFEFNCDWQEANQYLLDPKKVQREERKNDEQTMISENLSYTYKVITKNLNPESHSAVGRAYHCAI
jgi:hypothetical protein